MEPKFATFNVCCQKLEQIFFTLAQRCAKRTTKFKHWTLVFRGESRVEKAQPPPPQRIARCMLMLVRENLGQDLLAVRGVCTPGSALSLDKFKLRDHAPEIKHA